MLFCRICKFCFLESDIFIHAKFNWKVKKWQYFHFSPTFFVESGLKITIVSLESVIFPDETPNQVTDGENVKNDNTLVFFFGESAGSGFRNVLIFQNLVRANNLHAHLTESEENFDPSCINFRTN